jgi:hypothetical protein
MQPELTSDLRDLQGLAPKENGKIFFPLYRSDKLALSILGEYFFIQFHGINKQSK